MPESKAVIFTHFGKLIFDKNFARNAQSWIDAYKVTMLSFLKCNEDRTRIAIVYAYVDWAVRQVIPRINAMVAKKGQDHINIPAQILDGENQLIGILQSAENQARTELGLPQDSPPKFHYIGLNSLLKVYLNLIDVDPSLLNFLFGKHKQTTYDTPKFVDAVLRIARGDIPHLAHHPVIRVDHDTRMTPEGIDSILAAFADISKNKVVYFFSGKYGNSEFGYNPLDDHAVRLQYFFPEGTKSEDKRLLADYQPVDNDITRGRELCRTFLADLSELGATQIPNSERYFSQALRQVHQENRDTSPRRGSQQVISGAGLIMSRRAIQLLPPFMNFSNLSSWVDDHLKRRLHEVLGDINTNDLESVDGCCIQTRHQFPGITAGDHNHARNDYLDRLLRGCMLHAMITNNNGSPTDYSLAIRDIVLFKKIKFNIKEIKELRDNIYERAEERYREVLTCWATPEFAGTLIHNWADNKDDFHKKDQCTLAVDDAMGYNELVLKWHKITRAIERLPVIGQEWLYESV